MIFTKLTLHNYGLYAGLHEFALKPSAIDGNPRPLILFGGKNGAGKTTILSAIRLCLYGREALGYRTTTPHYHSYLEKMMHRSPLDTAEDAGVALEFEHMQGDELVCFRVERSWHRTETGTEESLVLRRNEAVQFGLAPEYWQSFLKDLVPPGISDLFFFDGERIQHLADDDQGGPALAAAVKDLLGINLIEQLEADLRVTRSRLGQNGADSSRDAQQELEEELGRLEMLHSSQVQDAAGVKAKIEWLEGKIEARERELNEQGGAFAANRSAAKGKAEALGEQVNRRRQDLRDMCAEILPFALAPGISVALMQQLRIEEKHEYRQSRAAVLRESAAAVAGKIRDADFWFSIATEQTSALKEVIGSYIQQTLLAEASNGLNDPAATIVHGLSAQDRERIMLWVDQALRTAKERALDHIAALQETQSDLERAQRIVEAAPPSQLLEPITQALQALYKERADLQSQYDQLIKAQKATVRQRVDVERKKNKLEEEQKRAQVKKGRSAQVEAVLYVLERFRHELLELKVSDLETVFAEYFNRLAQKRGFVSHVRIDRRDFSMVLVSREGRYIAKAQLSAGEKQIYAIAMLWALRTVAARPLPVIIDTPLGRLDSSHRRNLVDHYFPEASHQVIVLSTDTEIDAAYFTDLAPYVSHAYHLVYDDAASATRAEEGYFWQPALWTEPTNASE